MARPATTGCARIPGMTLAAFAPPLLRSIRAVAAAPLLATSVACVAAHADLTQADVRGQESFHVIQLGRAGYLIDARTETCLLMLGSSNSTIATPVSCALLKKSVPEAAQFITWDPAATPRV